MSTTGHENEAINVRGLKASLQKFKSELVDVKADQANTYTKTEVNALVSTPHQNFVTVANYASLPATGSADTIYRVSSWDGSANSGAGAVDATVYSEYAWNGSDYVFLCVKSQIDEVFDITAYNSNTKYADLAAALGVDGANIPSSLRRGGMSVKFVQSSDNKYVQYRLISDTFNTTPANWQGVDDAPTAGSDNLVKSGGVYDAIESVKNLLITYDKYNVNNLQVGYFRTDGQSIGDTLGSPRTSGGKYLKVPVYAGNKIIAKFYAYQNPDYYKAWIITDESMKIKDWSTDFSIEHDYRTIPFEYVPDVDGYLIINIIDAYLSYNENIDVIVYNGKDKYALEADFAKISEEVQAKSIYKYADFEVGYFNCVNASIGGALPSSITIVAYMRTLLVPVYAGKKVTVSNFVGYENIPYARAWILCDTDKKILSWCESYDNDYSETPLEITPSADGYIALLFNENVAPSPNVSVTVYENGTDWDKKIKVLQEEIDDISGNNIEITIPDVVYAIVGTELNLYNDSISYPIDKGLISPLNYYVVWLCNKGLITDRCFRFTPEAGDVGEVSCICKIYSTSSNLLIKEKTFIIKVLAKNALNSQKRTAFFGDSLGAASAIQLYNNFINTDRFGGTVPLMLGTHGNGAPSYDAVGGYAWSSYATAGETGWRASVSGVTSLALDAIYKDSNNHYFSIAEINITNGSGNILLIRSSAGYGDLVIPSGTLTKFDGAGDDTINYTDAFQESANPLWHNGALDFAYYRTGHLGLGANDKLDLVFFQLGINRSPSTVEGEINYIKDLYNAFILDNPNGKFVIGNGPFPGNDVNGCGVNSGASRNTKEHYDNMYKLNFLYNELLQDTTMPNLRVVAQRLCIDRYYGFGFSERYISDRYRVNENYHNNWVHPVTSGYQQIADELFAAYVGILTE